MKETKSRQEKIGLLDTLSIQHVEHFGRPLKEHLVGTHDLLERWGCSEDLCLAGLFHSVYGTGTFKSVSLPADRRQSLRQLIGVYAESLVYVFCMSDRRKLLMDNQSAPYYWVSHLNHERTGLSYETLADLVELEVANYLEQLPFGAVKTDIVFQDMQARLESAESLMSINARAAFWQAIEDYAHLVAACRSKSS